MGLPRAWCRYSTPSNSLSPLYLALLFQYLWWNWENTESSVCHTSRVSSVKGQVNNEIYRWNLTGCSPPKEQFLEVTAGSLPMSNNQALKAKNVRILKTAQICLAIQFNSIHFKFHYMQCTPTTNYITIDNSIIKEALCIKGNSFGEALLLVRELT